MSILKISKGADPNYLATVIKMPLIKEHPNANKLELVEVFGNTVVIAKDVYTPSELVVYFPVESCLSPKFLFHFNLYDNPALNTDGNTKGLFHTSCRVKAINLRGLPSQGFLFKVSKLAEYYEIKETEFNIGDMFDTVGSDILVTKYIKGDSKSKGENVKKNRIPTWVEKTIGVFPRPMRRNAYLFINYWYNKDNEGIKKSLIDGQFHFHYKTENGGKNIWTINPEDEITVSVKCHGTSFLAGNLLCKKRFNLFTYIGNKMGFTIPTTEYKFIYASRSALKNKRGGKYTEDLWGLHASQINGEIPDGITLYGEIIGSTSRGKSIQKNYQYGIPSGKSELWIYRITSTDVSGIVTDLSWNEIKSFCEVYNLKTVPVYFQGKAKDLFPEILSDENWNETFLSKLKDKYLDKKCEICNTGIINEGVVIRNESNPKKIALKFKSPVFILGETKARDNEEENIDEDN